MSQKSDRLQVKILNPCEDAAYKEWIVGRRESTIFHSPNWAKLLCESYGFRARYFALYECGEIKGCLPIMEVDSYLTGRRGVSLSFSDNCQAIVANEEEFRFLLEGAICYGRSQRWRYVEFRGETLLREEKACKEFVQHTLHLGEESVMHSKLRNSSARNIQKAMKEGVQIEIADDLASVLSFYDLHCLTRKRQGLPPQPKKYFADLQKHLLAEGLGFTALALYQGKPVAGLVCLRFGANAIYKYGASDEKYQNLRANNLLFWEMILKCAKDGYKSLSLGRTELNNSGLLLFKDGWGGERSKLRYHRYDFSRRCFWSQLPHIGGYEAFFKRLPVKVLRILGDMAYKHMG